MRLEHIPSTIKERDNTYRITSQPSKPLWATFNLSRGSRTINRLERYKKDAEAQLTCLRINYQEEKPNDNTENILIPVCALKWRLYPHRTKRTEVQTVVMDQNVPKMCVHEFENIEHLINYIYEYRRSKGRKITHILFHYSRCFSEWGRHSKAHWQLLWMSFISTRKRREKFLPSWASLDDMNIVL